MHPRHLPVLTGSFLSGIFLLLGLIGTFIFGPQLLRWRDAASWSRMPGEILSAELITVKSGRGGRTFRPEFSWRYEAGGETRNGSGYDVTGMSTNDLAGVEAILARFPMGSTPEVLVNPSDPGDSILEREPPTRLTLMLIPPFFAVLGLLGAFFTLTGWRGWYAPKTRNPFGRLVRGLVETMLRPAILKPAVVLVFILVGAGLVWWSVAKGNLIGVIVAIFLAYGLWQAMRTKPGSRRKR